MSPFDSDPRLAGDLSVADEPWPIRGHFAISRGAKAEAHVVVAGITSGDHTGRGECVPYARYGESVDGVIAEITARLGDIKAGLTRARLREIMPPGAARNALDCALWDLAARTSGKSAAQLAGLGAIQPLKTAYTLSLDTPEAMGAAAREAAHLPLLKVKLGGDGDEDRLAAIREGAPDARFIVDANEGWNAGTVEEMLALCASTGGVALVEQPLPADADQILGEIARPVPVCADESIHGLDTLAGLEGRYDAVNIKLDKTGGLTEALLVAEAARARGFKIMVGCMLGTSLAMAPAFLVAQGAEFVDLDGPLLLGRDREHGFAFDGAAMPLPDPRLWGG